MSSKRVKVRRTIFFTLIVFNLFVVFLIYKQSVKMPLTDLVKTISIHNHHLDRKSYLKIDWINYTFVTEESKRKGPGEQGKPVILTDETDLKRAEQLIHEYSFNVVASEKISLDRAVPDTRTRGCKGLKYSAVTVIVIFNNEHPSVLLRTVHSVVNRTPRQLLHEIILVDDCSTNLNLFDELDEHIMTHFPTLVRILRLKQRLGLMKARMEGIHQSQTEIVVVMDAHIEVNVNWLPPLIEPVAEDYRTATEPIVNFIDWNTMWYNDFVHPGHRGIFSWSLGYTMINRIYGINEKKSDNFEQPTLLGAIMAMNKNFFYELGEFDTGLRIWGGEQYDLSFKYWRCGGRILSVPCSTVGHNYKGAGFHPFAYNVSYVFDNLARVAETWFDQYRPFFYKATALFNYDPPDVSEQLKWKETRGCLSFDWYINRLYPEIFDRYPINITGYAFGAIQSVANPEYCVDSLNQLSPNPVGLYHCYNNISNPVDNQLFILSWRNQIRKQHSYFCWDFSQKNHTYVAKLEVCHDNEGNQFFRYLPEQQIIMAYPNHCLDSEFNNSDQELPKLFFRPCEQGKKTQQWIWGNINQTAFSLKKSIEN